MGKAIIELEWKDEEHLKLDEVINLAWNELRKCNVIDIVHRLNRTSYADID